MSVAFAGDVVISKPVRIAKNPKVMSVFESLHQPPGAPDGDDSALVPRIAICLGDDPNDLIKAVSEGSLVLNEPKSAIQHVGLTLAGACHLVPALIKAMSVVSQKYGKWLSKQDVKALREFDVCSVTTCTSENGHNAVYFNGRLLSVPVGETVLGAITDLVGDRLMVSERHHTCCEMESVAWPELLKDVPGYDDSDDEDDDDDDDHYR